MAFVRGDVVLLAFPFREVPSVVRVQLATVAAARILHRPGHLAASDLQRVTVSLRQVLEL